MQFVKAERKKARLRLALAGPSGSGKTWSALAIATGLGGKIAVIDTEHESASIYSDNFQFDTLSLQAPYSPERFITAIEAAETAGYDILVIDSYSHEWNGSGGCLEINEALANAKFKGNTWAAWNETTPRHRKLLDKILASPLHIIATMRSKTETVQGENKKVMKLGMKSEQRDGTDYEFTTVLDIQHDSHMATSSKDRTGLFTDPFIISKETGNTLREWLGSGVDPLIRATTLAKGLVVDIQEAPDMNALQAAFMAAREEVRAFPTLAEMIMDAKDKRKAELLNGQPTKVAEKVRVVEPVKQQTRPATTERDAILADIAKAEFVEEFYAIEDRMALLTIADRDYCYDAMDQKKIELEGNSQEFTPPPEEPPAPELEEVPACFLDESDYNIKLEQLETVAQADALIKQIEEHPVPDERSRLLVKANRHRRALLTQQQGNAA